MADYDSHGGDPPVQPCSVLMAQGQEVDLQPVFWGMEEEGIPFEVQEVPRGEAVGRWPKKRPTCRRLMSVSASKGAKGMLALHHRDLPADHPLFVLKLREAQHVASCDG